MEPIKRIRPTIMLIVIGLVGITIYALMQGALEAATGCIVGLVALGPKIVESETLDE